MKKIICLMILAILMFSSTVFAKDYIKATEIQNVSLGDTFEQVTQKIGEPQQVLSKELTSDGKEQVVWQYETVKPPDRGVALNPIAPWMHKKASEKMADQSIYQQEREKNPPYLVIFINGKVAKIQRQKIDPNTNQPVSVVVY